MQTAICYVAAGNAIGALRNRDNSLGAPAPVLTAGVPVLLKLRLFPDVGVSSPYPLSDLSEISGWSFELDSDYDGGTTCKIVADNAEITAATVTDGGTQFTEVAVPISQMYTEELAAALGAKPGVTLNGELVGYNSAGEARFVVQINGFTVRNRISGLTSPTPIPPDGYDRIASAVISSAIETGGVINYSSVGEFVDRKIESGGYVNSSGAQTVASNAAVVTMLSGGQAAIGGVSAIKLWFESGVRENCFADLVMSSKSLTLVSSGGNFVFRPDNYFWVSTGIGGFGDISNTLNAPEVSAGFFAVSSGGAVVVSATGVTETFLEGPTGDPEVIDGLIASSTDGGSTWTFGDAGIYWGTNGVEAEEDGVSQGWCHPEWGIGRCCGAELQTATASASGALLSNTEIDTVLGNYRLTYTSNGGLAISGGGVQLKVSGGKCLMSAGGAQVGVDRYDGITIEAYSPINIAANAGAGVNVSAFAINLAPEDGLSVSAGNAEVRISGDGIIGSASGGEDGAAASFELKNSAVTISVGDDGHDASLSVGAGDIYINANGADKKIHLSAGEGVLINGSRIDRKIVTSSTATSVTIPVASGGTRYVFTQPLTSLCVGSVIDTQNEDMVEFTLASGGVVDLPNCRMIPPDRTFENGSSYVMAINYGYIIAVEYKEI